MRFNAPRANTCLRHLRPVKILCIPRSLIARFKAIYIGQTGARRKPRSVPFPRVEVTVLVVVALPFGRPRPLHWIRSRGRFSISLGSALC
jgi:hypothetical protein